MKWDLKKLISIGKAPIIRVKATVSLIAQRKANPVFHGSPILPLKNKN
jgi:hypothetical protein